MEPNFKQYRLVLITALLWLWSWATPAFAQNQQHALTLIQDFYRDYLNFDYRKNTGKKVPELSYTSDFKALLNKNLQLCKKFADGPCGFAADGDPYLDAQDMGDNLNAENAQLQVLTLAQSPHSQTQTRVQASFLLFPGSSDERRVVTYLLKYEKQAWRVDDIFYQSGSSARQQMHAEIRLLKQLLKAPASK